MFNLNSVPSFYLIPGRHFCWQWFSAEDQEGLNEFLKVRRQSNIFHRFTGSLTDTLEPGVVQKFPSSVRDSTESEGVGVNIIYQLNM